MLSSSPSTNNNTTTNTNSTTDLMSSSSPSKNTTLTVPSSRSAFAPFSRSNNTPITNQASLTTSTANNEDHQNNNNQGNNPTTTENPFTKYYSSQSALKLMTIGLALHKDFNKKKTLTEPSIGVNNDGLDNADGNLIIYAGSILGERYYVKEMLGQGTFGQVVKCEDLTSKQIVAVKVVKNKPSYLRQARIEINILDELAKYGSNGSHHIITKLGEFNHQNHLCIVIEILGMNLFELIKQNRFKGLSLNVLSVFLSQLLDALCILSEANIIHCDLKPENILLTDLSHPKDLVRLIDFGSACHENEMGPFYIQSRFYRAPEVIFGMRYNKSIDMWSLGCICAELFLGLPLLPGVSQYNQVGRMIEMFGIPPPYMIEYGKHSVKYFKIIPPNRMNPNDTDLPKHQDGTPSMYELKSERQFLTENPKEVSMEWKRYFNYTKLPDLVRHYGDISKVDEKEMRTRDSFIDFLNGLLQLDPYKRWTPDQAKLHPFVTGKDFVEPFIPPHTPQYLAHMRTLQQLHSSERVTPQQVQQQQVYNPQYYGSTPNQSFLPFGLSPVAGGNFMGGSSLLGMSPVANNTYQKPSSYVGSFDQQIPLGSSPYLKPGIPISGSHNNQMPVGSYGSSVGSLYGSSFGSNANLTFGVSPGVHNYPPQFYNGMYQASPSGSNLGVSPGAYSSSLLGTTPSAAGTPSGSRGRSSTLSGKNPYHHHHNNSNVDNLSFNMAEMTLEDGNNNTNPNITFSKERPRSFSSAKYHNNNNGTPSSSWNSNGGGRMNTSGGQPNKNNPYHQNNNGSAGNINTNNNKSNKGYKNSPTGKHSRKGRSTDIEGESSDDNWNPFFPSDLDDDSASSTGFNPYYSKKNNSGSGLSDYQGSPSGKGANFGSPPKQIPTNTNKEYSPKNSYDEGSFSKPRHGSIPQNTPNNNSGKKNFGNQQKKRTNNY